VAASNQPKPLDAESAGKPAGRMRRPTGEARPQVRNEHEESEYRRSAGFSAEPGDMQNQIQLAIDVEAVMRTWTDEILTTTTTTAMMRMKNFRHCCSLSLTYFHSL